MIAVTRKTFKWVSVFTEGESCRALFFWNILCSHFLPSRFDIQGADTSGSLWHIASQTNRFYPRFVQLVSSLLPPYSLHALLFGSQWTEADWQLILSALTFISLFSALSWMPLKEKRGFSHWPVDFLNSLSLVHGSDSKKTAECSWFPRSTLWISEQAWVFIKEPLGCQVGSGGASVWLCLCGCVLICWLQRLFKLTSYFQREQTHFYLNAVILVQKHKTWQEVRYLLCTELSSTKPRGSGLFEEFAINFQIN